MYSYCTSEKIRWTQKVSMHTKICLIVCFSSHCFPIRLSREEMNDLLRVAKMRVAPKSEGGVSSWYISWFLFIYFFHFILLSLRKLGNFILLSFFIIMKLQRKKSMIHSHIPIIQQCFNVFRCEIRETVRQSKQWCLVHSSVSLCAVSQPHAGAVLPSVSITCPCFCFG